MVLIYICIFFPYGNEDLHNNHKTNSHLAPWQFWVPGIQKKVITKCKNQNFKNFKIVPVFFVVLLYFVVSGSQSIYLGD